MRFDVRTQGNEVLERLGLRTKSTRARVMRKQHPKLKRRESEPFLVKIWNHAKHFGGTILSPRAKKITPLRTIHVKKRRTTVNWDGKLDELVRLNDEECAFTLSLMKVCEIPAQDFEEIEQYIHDIQQGIQPLNISKLHRWIPGRLIVFLCSVIFRCYGNVYEQVNIEADKLVLFLNSVEKLYDYSFYANTEKVAMSLYALHVSILNKESFDKATPAEIYAALLAPLIEDAESMYP